MIHLVPESMRLLRVKQKNNARKMGLLFSSLFKKETRVLMLGLDAAGKTTTLYKLKLDEYVTSIPTIGFNVETVKYKNLNMTIWDVGGQDRIRNLWKHYYENADALIFMIDSTDRPRFNEVADELFKVLTNEILVRSLKAVLIYCNKCDSPNTVPINDILSNLNLDRYRNVKWHAQECSAMNGTGLYEGLDKLAEMLE